MDERAVCFGPESFGVHLSGRRNFLRLEILLRTPPSGESLESISDPFIRVKGESRLGSLFLARLRSNDGALDRFVVLKVLWDSRLSGARRARPAETNPTQVRLFQEEYRALRLLREGDADPVLRLAPFDLKTGGGVELPRHLPLFFCKRRQLFFSPRCARCAEPLQDCQEDELLAQHGLPTYSGSNVRHLHCPSCSREAGGARFFSVSVEPGAPARAGVGDGRALLASFGELARRGPAGITDFPCAECGSTGVCYPAAGEGDAARVLVPFSFHDFHAFVHESMPLRFDECCDLLGGRDPAEVLAGSEAARADLGLRGVPLFFRVDPEVRGPLEVLLLKLALCRELCVGVRAIHRRFEKPHLNLRPETVWIGTGGTNLAFPGAWDLVLRVTPPDQPVPAGPAGADGESVYAWPASPDPLYAPRRLGEEGAGLGYDLFGCGMLLLRALLTSRDQGADVLARHLSLALDGTTGEPADLRARSVLQRLPASLTDPAHLFWEPVGAGGPGLSPDLWSRSLRVALELVCRSADPDPEAVLDSAVEALGSVEGEVRRALFFDQPRRGWEIRQVLSELLQDEAWAAAVEAGSAARPEPAVERRPAPVAPPTPPPPPEPAPDFEATVILGRGRGAVPEAPARPAAVPASAAAAAEPDLEATMISGRPVWPPAPPEPAAPEVDMEATIIAGRGGVRPAASAPPTVPPAEPGEGADQGGFEETIILPAALRKGKGLGER